VGSSKVGGRVVVCAIGLAVLTCFAPAEEVTWPFGAFLADPDFPNLLMMSFDVSTEFMITVKALRLLVTEATEGRFARQLLSNCAGNLGLVRYCTVFGLKGNDSWLA
jgi:hypothetical protein